jgi:diketogulonate reductase-like aldo/keto reductase
LKVGARHFDLARVYASERHVGDVLGRHFANGDLAREDVFLTTKIFFPRVPPHVNISPILTWNLRDVPSIAGRVRDDFEDSLQRIGVGYVDLLLMHWPGTFTETDADYARRARAEIWNVFQQLLHKKVNQLFLLSCSALTLPLIVGPGHRCLQFHHQAPD